MDGYQFQKFIASLFQKMGFSNVKVGPAGADAGIDIEMEQTTDVGTVRYILECKHHAKGSIGRPVVQKLHSAMITKGMNKGIVISSGYFSSDAIQYAENVGIELIDIDKLKELAKRVGVSIQHETSLSMENCFPISNRATIIDVLHNFLQNDLVGFQKNLLRVERIQLKLKATYMIDYSINASFSTSSGLIHSINDKSFIFLDSEKGELINPIITNPFVSLKHTLQEIEDKDIEGIEFSKEGEFIQNFRDVKEKARETLRKLYTKTVSYYGANNVHYSKVCIPKKRDITISDAKRVFLPSWGITFSMLRKKYLIVATETSGKLNVFPTELVRISNTPDTIVYPDKCVLCSKELKESYLCNECGAIVCSKDKFECKICGKVICKEDVLSKRRFLVLSDKYCSACAKSQGIMQ
jgi:restriction system protein